MDKTVMIKITLTQIKDILSCLLRFKALKNFSHLKFESIFKSSKMKGKPYYFTLESGNVCNLSCLLCPTGQKRDDMKKGFLEFENFKKILNKCATWLFFLEFYNWGEPFLNKNFLKMVRYARMKNIFVVASSNLNFKILTFDEAKDIVASGLNQLTVSCAGASDKTIETYQVGASFEKAYSNMRMIMLAKRALGKNTPFVQWRFLVTKYTEFEIGIAKKLSHGCCSHLTLLPINCDMAKEVFLNPTERFRNVEAWLPTSEKLCLFDKTKQRRKDMRNRNKCSYLWSRMTVNWNGDVFPCCKAFGDRFAFGNLLEDSLDSIWNSISYQNARKTVLDHKSHGSLICDCCQRNEAMS